MLCVLTVQKRNCLLSEEIWVIAPITAKDGVFHKGISASKLAVRHPVRSLGGQSLFADEGL
jgi:hypothetical protein